MAESGAGEGRGAMVLADLFCRNARRRIAGNFRAMWRNDDDRKYRVARQVLDGKHRWLEEGVIAPEFAGPAPESPQ